MRIFDFFRPYDPREAGGGVAEAAARLAPLLATAPDALDEALARIPPARLARILSEGPDAAALRTRYAIADREAALAILAAAQDRVARGGARPLAALAEALDTHRRAVAPGARAADAVVAAKARLLDAWARALDRIAPGGAAIDEGAARALGLGRAVYLSLCAEVGETSEGPIPADAFRAKLPRLLCFWPLTPEGLATIEALERVVAETLARESATIVPLEARR
ncbi:hypothetical protein [Salinarimonas sp.]|uniref:hypothetical protein n=1 Tax=Salinarimonas sp. TaxID=2766526 RepID=UPI003918A929